MTIKLTVSELRRVPVDPSDVYFLEAVGDNTLVCLRSKRRHGDLDQDACLDAYFL